MGEAKLFLAYIKSAIRDMDTEWIESLSEEEGSLAWVCDTLNLPVKFIRGYALAAIELEKLRKEVTDKLTDLDAFASTPLIREKGEGHD